MQNGNRPPQLAVANVDGTVVDVSIAVEADESVTAEALLGAMLGLFLDDGIEGNSGAENTKGEDVIVGSNTKSEQKLNNQMNKRGWTEQEVRNTIDSPYTTRTSTNKATGNPATVYYTEEGAYVIVDDITKKKGG